MRKTFAFFAFLFIFLSPLSAINAQTAVPEEPTVYLFGRDDCGFCKKEFKYLYDEDIQYKYLNIVDDEQAKDLYNQVTAKHSISKITPVTVVGETVIVGFNSDRTTGESIKRAIEKARTSDIKTVEDHIALAPKQQVETAIALLQEKMPHRFDVAVDGEFQTAGREGWAGVAQEGDEILDRGVGGLGFAVPTQHSEIGFGVVRLRFEVQELVEVGPHDAAREILRQQARQVASAGALRDAANPMAVGVVRGVVVAGLAGDDRALDVREATIHIPVPTEARRAAARVAVGVGKVGGFQPAQARRFLRVADGRHDHWQPGEIGVAFYGGKQVVLKGTRAFGKLQPLVADACAIGFVRAFHHVH